MNNAILIRYGEMFLKGKNKYVFEKILFNNIKNKLKNFKFELKKISGRYFITDYDEENEILIIEKLCKVCAIYSVSPAVLLDSIDENIREYIQTIRLSEKSFRVTVNRGDKKFNYTSIEYQKILGAIICKNNPKIVVDLHSAEIEVGVDLRENGSTFIYHTTYPGIKGLPVGSSSAGLLLLSGGIDSPVAGFMMAKRGMPITALHFHSYPYTSELAKNKVVELAGLMTEYTGKIRMHIVSFTKIQEEIHKNCKEEYMITIMRRIMMRIAERIAKADKIKGIITGESLGQVASQTIESINSSNSVINIPVLRPLIGMDKDDITEIAKKINTFNTSILPYEDCCTVFLPKHPLIKPNLIKVVEEESKLDIENLINNAINSSEVVEIKSR